MNWVTYLKLVEKTRQYPELGVTGLSYPLLKLQGEFGEFLDSPSIKEAGDILWYITDIHYSLDVFPDDTYQDLAVISTRYVNKQIGPFYELVGKLERKQRFNQEDKARLLTLLPEIWKPFQYALHTLRIEHYPDISVEVIAGQNIEKLLDRLDRNVIIGEGDNR